MLRYAIDFEYFYDDSRNLVPLCVAMCDGAKSHCWWLLDPIQRGNFVRTVRKHQEDAVFIAHAVEAAEGRCFHALGLLPEEYRWRDTFVESIIVNNTNKMARPENSLAAVTKRWLQIDVDTDEKDRCRAWIINRDYQGHEAEIMAYCEHDVANLLDIADKLHDAIKTLHVASFPIKHTKQPFHAGILESYGATAARYATIACRGIPLDGALVNKLRNNAPACLAAIQAEFCQKYPIYECVKGRMVRKSLRVQEMLQTFARERCVQWERTAKGSLSTAEHVLKAYKGQDCFPAHLREHGKLCRTLSSFCKDGEKNWLHNYNPEKGTISPSLFPYGTQTGRCAAKPRSGFIYTWGKLFRGLINPPKGYSLIEMDYGSEEVCISAEWADDKAMMESYLSNDYYLAFMQRCGKFPADLALPTEQERGLPIYLPYKGARQLAKGCCLGLSYGMGAEKLGGVMGCSATTAADYRNAFEKVYHRYALKRRGLRNAINGTRKLTLAFADGFLYTMHKQAETRSINSLLNLPIQGLGSVILRELVRICFARGLYLIATIHDAVVVLCRDNDVSSTSEALRTAMLDAAEIVLGSRSMKVGAPEITKHGHPQAHGAEAEWEQLLSMLDTADNQRTPDTSDIFLI